MEEITLLSNKAKKQLYKYSILILIAVITWVLQLSIFSNFVFNDTTPNIMLLTCIFFGLVGGPVPGIFYGVITSFFVASNLYDHTFYLSYPIIGLISGIFTKNIFADELVFFIILSIFLIVPLELINGFQYNLKNPVEISSRIYPLITTGFLINAVMSPFFYLFFTTLSKKLHLR